MSSSEHNENEAVPSEEEQKDQQSPRCPSTRECPLKGKQVVGILLCVAGCALLWTTFSRPDASTEFLKWVQANPYLGIGAFLIVFAVCVVFMIPVGTPLTLGCGYIYKGVYGWVLGVGVATAVSMAGSALGAVTCFLLGRYMMRDQVRKWVRKYPLFDAIDIAVAEHGLRIMAMLYLTPILPLGPVSYMCGSTSMALSSFVIAKIASLPLMLLYVFVGASAGTLIADAKALENDSIFIVGGIILSLVMITGISHYIRKELMEVLGRQKQSSEDKKDQPSGDGIELGIQSTSKSEALQRRHTAFVSNSSIEEPSAESDNQPKHKQKK